MANRKIETFENRQDLLRMRQGDTDRALARTQLMGRKKATAQREVTRDHRRGGTSYSLPGAGPFIGRRSTVEDLDSPGYAPPTTPEASRGRP